MFVLVSFGSTLSRTEYVTSNGSSETIQSRNFVSSEDAQTWAADVIVPDWLHFRSLIRLWHDERGVMASATQMAMCPAYQRIIAMGEKAVPMILSELKSEGDKPDHWFWALRILTGANPVTDSDRGNLPKMAQAWLRWGNGRYVH
jgi:hypothetical protein